MAELRSLPKCKTVYQAPDSGRTILLQRATPDYDQINTVDMLTAFNHFLVEVVARYEANERSRQACEQKSQDLLHYIELHDDMNASEGYKVYRKLAEVRRERRSCKNENELLTPIYSFIQQNPRVINDFATVLGRTRTARECIEKRIYSAKTDII